MYSIWAVRLELIPLSDGWPHDALISAFPLFAHFVSTNTKIAPSCSRDPESG